MREDRTEGRIANHRVAGSVFRADHPDHTDLAETVEASRSEPGRFNTSRFGAIYVSREPDTALDELRKNNGQLEHPCALFVVKLSANRVVDLSNPRERERWQLTKDDLTSDDLSRCREVAEAAVHHGAEVIVWPSATGSGLSLAVFAERLGPESHVEVVRTFELGKTVLTSVAAGLSVVSIHPMLTTFNLFGPGLS